MRNLAKARAISNLPKEQRARNRENREEQQTAAGECTSEMTTASET
jgi:hypothetical protein